MKLEMINLNIDVAVVSRIVQRAIEQAAGAELATGEPLGAPVVPALGEYWPGQGGVNAGLVRGREGVRDYYLIVARGVEDEFEDLAYGPRDCEVTGADSVWDGLANTKALLESGKPHPAAEAASSFTCDGHRDFYLPARRELQLAEASVAEVFSKAWHWSSTQRSADYAFLMIFGDGTQYYGGKYGELRVRPVRRLFI